MLANPPWEVSRYFSSMSLPVRYMVATTSSKEILRVAYRKRDRFT